ncbi:ATP-binding cassette domain-containing protein [Shimazuella kribbensis]|uniref:ATP-binding cassette domain-containing protein n=1 Tax=Shimazuella kribbensis TaxID=139808 RepID=UPI000413520C|nr:ABC transporter ATP-binding protein [Shimazuella kribbensis]
MNQYSLRKCMEATRRRLSTLRGKGTDKKTAEPLSASQSFSDQLLWKLAKSDGNSEEDQLVFTSLNLLKNTIQQNKKLCARIFVWSALVSLIGVLSFYVLKLALEVESMKVVLPLLIAAAFLNAADGRGFPFWQTFHDGDILQKKIRKNLIEEIARKLKIVHRESLRKYINKNGSLGSLAKSISKSIGNDLLVVVKDPLIWFLAVAALWIILSWEFAIALVVGSFLLLFMVKPAINKKQEISKEEAKVESKSQTKLDTWSELPRLHSDRDIIEATAQELEDLLDQDVAINESNSFQLTWLVSGPRTIGTFLLLVILLPYAIFVKHMTIDVILLAAFFKSGLAAFATSIEFTLRVAEMRGELVKLGRLLELPNRPKGSVKMRGFGGLDLRNISIQYGNKILFPDGLNLQIPKGEPGKSYKVAFVGPSGCGKSSVMDLLARNLEKIEGSSTGWTGKCLVIHPNGEEDSIDQIDLGSFPKYIISVPQETEVLSAESVARNIGLAVEKLPAEQKEQIVHKLSGLMQLPLDSLDKLAQEQSGGQRKRTQIASALALALAVSSESSHPVALLLDEALSQLDQETALFVLQAIEELADKRGDTIVMIAHSEYGISDDSYVYVFGPDGQGVIQEGWKRELASDPSSAYNKVFKGQLNSQT